MSDLNQAREFAERGELDKAWEITDAALKRDPNDVIALVLASFIMEKSGKPAMVYQLAKRVTELAPRDSAGWTNLGRACDELWRIEESERCYKRALACGRNARQTLLANVNLSALYVQCGRFADSEKYAKEALAVDPENLKARHNVGVAQLARRDWANGWRNYSASIGSPHRRLWKYMGDEPEWDGSPGKTIVIYGEQGLGDEISSASMFPDAIARAGKVILDCDPRLVGLYKRSFPTAKVYGTRNAKALSWEAEDRQIDASISSMELGKLFRLKDEDFPGTAYLQADPDRALMWRSLFGAKTKPVIGIAWSGGTPSTGARFRQWSLDDLLPIFRAVDAHWVSLQYRDANEEIKAFSNRYPWVDLVQYPYGTLTKDYDDTAALVSALDRVVCIQTAVAHLAGALGKPCTVFVPKNSQWRYGTEGEDVIWYRSVRIARQMARGEWADAIEREAEKLRADYGRVPERTRAVA